MKEKVRRQIASMIDGRPDIVVYADRPLTSNEHELIRENVEESTAYPMDEPLHIHLEGEDISDVDRGSQRLYSVDSLRFREG